ncbi:DUF445 family protein [Ruficoccus amylovorans]|uniref:DUF445 family protein n=1 Tax=Ruficoccus amylovorans TaxID=1804625 RepID=A0A842HHV3_9BACT|nr:DUF445 family protein [Ruficoccus amylovorans]MBC2595144.1 DUF445 family protein [Ruficoccus amylovorans]
MPSLDAIFPLAWIPFVTAFIGWLTNWVAIQMLFRPRRKVRVFFLKWQGLIPRRQADVADTVAEVIEREVLSQHTIRTELERLDVTGRLDAFVRRVVRDKAGRKLQAIPLIGSFINDRTIGMIEQAAVDAVHEEADKMRSTLAEDLEKHLQIRDIVRQRIAEFDLDKLESVVKQVASREFRLIEWLGGILGFIIGLVQVAILLLIGQA